MNNRKAVSQEDVADFSHEELVEIRKRASALARTLPFDELVGLDEVIRQSYLELGRAAAVLKECIEWRQMREELEEARKQEGAAHEQPTVVA